MCQVPEYQMTAMENTRTATRKESPFQANRKLLKFWLTFMALIIENYLWENILKISN